MTNTHLTRDLGLALVKEHVPAWKRLREIREKPAKHRVPARAPADFRHGALATGTALSQGAAGCQPAPRLILRAAHFSSSRP